MPDPAPGVPAWHPDPEGRHQFRWWDGARFTDQVGDAGQVSVDPLAPAPAPAPAPSRQRWPMLAIAAVLVVAALAAAWFFLVRDEGSGTGTFEGRAAPDELGTHSVEVPGGTALSVVVEPGSDLDAVVAFVVTADDADRLEELFEDLGLVEVQSLEEAFDAADDGALDGFADDDRAVFRTDVRFGGEEEELLLAVPFDVDVQVVVGPFSAEDDDDYTVTIEAFSIDTSEGDDGEDVLEAVVDGDDVPAGVQALAEELLEPVD